MHLGCLRWGFVLSSRPVQSDFGFLFDSRRGFTLLAKPYLLLSMFLAVELSCTFSLCESNTTLDPDRLTKNI